MSKLPAAERQACYAGAIGMRAIHKLRSFTIEDPKILYNNNVYTITTTYPGTEEGVLRLYAHRPIKPSVPGGSMKYRMTLSSRFFCIGGSPNTFSLSTRSTPLFEMLGSGLWKRRHELVAVANGGTQNMATASVSISPACFFRLFLVFKQLADKLARRWP